MARTMTWVAGVLQCAHHSKHGRLHGHTYEVRAFWPSGRDAIELQRELEQVLKLYDHRGLGSNESTGEQLAELIASKLSGCVMVEVNRPLERIGAVWHRD